MLVCVKLHADSRGVGLKGYPMSLAHDDCGLVPGRTMATNAELMEEINRARVPE